MSVLIFCISSLEPIFLKTVEYNPLIKNLSYVLIFDIFFLLLLKYKKFPMKFLLLFREWPPKSIYSCLYINYGLNKYINIFFLSVLSYYIVVCRIIFNPFYKIVCNISVHLPFICVIFYELYYSLIPLYLYPWSLEYVSTTLIFYILPTMKEFWCVYGVLGR